MGKDGTCVALTPTDGPSLDGSPVSRGVYVPASCELWLGRAGHGDPE